MVKLPRLVAAAVASVGLTDFAACVGVAHGTLVPRLTYKPVPKDDTAHRNKATLKRLRKNAKRQHVAASV
jgi:hypothetical protein